MPSQMHFNSAIAYEKAVLSSEEYNQPRLIRALMDAPGKTNLSSIG